MNSTQPYSVFWKKCIKECIANTTRAKYACFKSI